MSSVLLELFYPEGFTTNRSHNTTDVTAALFFTKTSSLLDMTPCGLVNIYRQLLMSSTLPSLASKQSEMIELLGP